MHRIYVLCFFLCVMYDSTGAECNVTQFTCSNGNCINLAWQCDGDGDCSDNSDENECSSTTCADGFFRCDNGKCIPERWVCDDTSECHDGSDEKPEQCKNQKCPGYRCNNSSQCVPNEWKCDGQPDCPKDDDESECPSACDPMTEFQCTDKRCIPIRWKCDHHNDCDDGLDESKCLITECDTAKEKICSDGECINELWWCDGDADCKDKSDEDNCTEKLTGQTCESTEFHCVTALMDTQCINAGWKCDGDEDCIDGSDESSCFGHTCSPAEVNCDNHSCIRVEYQCDGENDCPNGEDEKDCDNTETIFCMDDEFGCSLSAFHKCISADKVCDGVEDCGNGEDEAPDLNCPSKANNTCNINSGGCSQVCIQNTSIESDRICECFPGFSLISGSSTECKDVDECAVSGTCSQTCINTKGSYKCDCITGYNLTNHRYCKAIGGHAELILSDRHDLSLYHLETYHYSLLLDQRVSGAVALDFDIRNKIIIWSDVQSETIYSANLTSGVVKRIIEDNIRMPDGLAVDWIHGNLYLSDAGLDRIEVSRLDGSCRKTLVEKDLVEPRALVVDPNNGWMYWTDWGNKQPKIEKCGMNGEHRKEIVTKHILWPNGLTIDYVQQRLYWVDAKLHNIGSCDLDGNNYKMILKNHKNLGHPFAITVFEDYLFWTDWASNAVHRVSKFGHDNGSTVALDLKMPMGIQVYHIYRQPVRVNHCGENNGGCSHLCLPVPQVKMSAPLPKQSVCACPDSMILVDNFTCKKSGIVATTKKPSPSYKDVTGENRPQTHRPDPQYTIHPTDETTVTMFKIEQTTEDTAVNTSYNAVQSENVGFITGIVIIILVVTGFIIFVVIFILLKRHKSRNAKSMNFDNPVYRKTTTDDQLIMDKSGSNLPQSMLLLNQDSEMV